MAFCLSEGPGRSIPADRVYRGIICPSPHDLRAFYRLGIAYVLIRLAPDALMDSALRPVWPGAKTVGPAMTARNALSDTLANCSNLRFVNNQGVEPHSVIRISPNVAPGNVVIEMDRIVSEDVEIIGTGS